MKNVNAIFSEFSIINVKFLYKLAKKYVWITASIPVVVCALTAFLYLRQHDIYSAKIAFRNIGGMNDSPTNAISDLLGEKKERVGPGEFLTVVKSVDFLQKAAQKLVSDPNFENMTFSPVESTGIIRSSEMFSSCLDDQCKITKLRGMIPKLFNIDLDENIDTRFIITVKTLDSYTTNKVINAIKEALIEHRLTTIKVSLTNQKEVTAKLIEERKESLTSLGIMEKFQEISQINALLDGLEGKFKVYQDALESKKIEYSQAEISLRLTNKALKKDVDPKLKQKWKVYQSLRAKRDILLTDIAALEQVAGDKSSQGSQIVKELKQQITTVNKEIATLEKARDIVNFEGFRETKGRDKDYVEFQGKVLEDQIVKLEARVEGLIDERKILVTKVKNLEQEIEKHKPSIEYLKLLEQKLLQVQLIEGTIVSDVNFDNFLLSSAQYKRHSLGRTIAFAIVVSLFLIVTGLLLRYLFDERIIDREDFQNNFRDIEVLGDVPEL
tara:strand:+ start:552 stop:2042 length:1491 start_codon:yes stop_codon:yes gene_type:complete